MNVYARLIVLGRMHPIFRKYAFSQIKEGELWQLDAWTYLMGGEL